MTSTLGSNTVLGGRYRLTERIAAGGQGEVWRAEDTALGRVGAEYRVTGLDLGFCCARWFGSGRIAGWLCGCCT
jgi:hypothetical protein